MEKRIRAAVISFFIPGGGQLYRKRFISGIFFLLLFLSSLYFLKVIWRGFHPFSFFILFSYLVFWLVNIVDAYKGPYYFNAPCDTYCPADIKPSIYISLLSEENTEEAFRRLLESVPFPGALGRICTAPCENPCSRSGIDESIRIRYLKRFIFDFENEKYHSNIHKNNKGKKVAIVGGGVCGLTCAYNLKKKGYKVVVFEREKKAGGMLQLSIPDYRLPRWVVDKEIMFVKETGVEIITGIEVGKDKSFNDLREEYDAVFIATGTHLCNRLYLGEEKLGGVYYGLKFLKLTKEGNPPSVGKETIVIGGGDVGIDVARTAVRLGSRVKIISLEKREEMPTNVEKVKKAVEEGIIIKNCWGVSEIYGSGNVEGVKFKFCRSVFNGEGIFKPTFDESVQEGESCDTLIICTGQIPELAFLPATIKSEGKIVVNRALMTPIPGVFAGGDIIFPSTCVEAIRDGKKAAQSIDLYLRGFRSRLDRLLSFTEYPIPNYPVEKALDEKEILSIPIKGNTKNFEEIEGDCIFRDCILEAKRCLKCPLRFGNF
jgi:NADH-quinone oxidoreductase subunit F